MQRHRNDEQGYDDRGGSSQQQGMGQRGRYDQNYGGYDDGRYGGGPQRRSQDRGYYVRGADRGGREGYAQQQSYGRGGGYEQRHQEQRGRDEGRFGGSRRDAFDHGRHPSQNPGGYDPMHYGQQPGEGYGYGYGSRGGYDQDATYDRNGYRVSNRGGYEDQGSYGNSGRDRYGHGQDHGHDRHYGADDGRIDQECDRCGGTGRRSWDNDRYGRGSRGPFDRY